jgi:hypothetical protein
MAPNRAEPSGGGCVPVTPRARGACEWHDPPPPPICPDGELFCEGSCRPHSQCMQE